MSTYSRCSFNKYLLIKQKNAGASEWRGSKEKSSSWIWAPATPVELQLCGPDDLWAPPRGALARPGEIESVQFLRDLQEGLAFGLREEETSVEGPTDTDAEERHIEEVGQSLLRMKDTLRPGVVPFSPQT